MIDLKDILLNSLYANRPSVLVSNWIKDSLLFETGNQTPVYITSLGKAGMGMAQAFANFSNITITAGLVVAPELGKEEISNRFHLYRSKHPIPDESSYSAGKQLARFVESIPKDALLINCISGGTSSLVIYPSAGITVRDIANTHELLINSGASIREINIVRKHLSQIKGGGLLTHIDPQVQVVDLIISDVPGDDTEVIGSGLTTSDSSTFEDAHQILITNKLWNQLPKSIQNHIKKGLEAKVAETLKPGKDPVKNHRSYVIGSAQKLAKDIAERLYKAGYRVIVAPETYTNNIERVASLIAERAIKVAANKQRTKPVGLIYVGESTVRVTGSGKGGRNQELALVGAMQISGSDGITWLSAGTDGVDGPTDAAGAIVDGNTIARAKKEGIDPMLFLNNNDSYHFHQRMGTLLKTGPTGNNLMDVQIVVIE